ncbi:hypothetical protein JQ604_27150 [Bradyrhizobium jicamae]|uniref:hypothetical protein n=1 Tax=Bradyrhizobium jicamae TaxID=280332 RepID=UPI001BAD8AED|nr:hypothetical protein [Bradyrhizobium jicamae]MBR0755865.1 hypothetical protein [Bradyrhizobium jicamae]
MKKSEAKSLQSVDETLEAPVRLTPDQLETVAAGFAVKLTESANASIKIGTGTIWGLYPVEPSSPLSALQALSTMK